MVGQSFGGRQVEQLVREALRQEYPAFRPDASQIRNWLENFGFVGEPVSSVAVKVEVDGVERERRERAVEIAPAIGPLRPRELRRGVVRRVHVAQRRGVVGGGAQRHEVRRAHEDVCDFFRGAQLLFERVIGK